MKLPNTVAYSGAKVTVTDSEGGKQSKWLVHGEGMSSESSPVLIFGLAENDAASVDIKPVGGDVESVSGPFDGGAFDLLKSRKMSIAGWLILLIAIFGTAAVARIS